MREVTESRGDFGRPSRTQYRSEEGSEICQEVENSKRKRYAEIMAFNALSSLATPIKIKREAKKHDIAMIYDGFSY